MICVLVHRVRSSRRATKKAQISRSKKGIRGKEREKSAHHSKIQCDFESSLLLLLFIFARYSIFSYKPHSDWITKKGETSKWMKQDKKAKGQAFAYVFVVQKAKWRFVARTKWLVFDNFLERLLYSPSLHNWEHFPAFSCLFMLIKVCHPIMRFDRNALRDEDDLELFSILPFAILNQINWTTHAQSERCWETKKKKKSLEKRMNISANRTRHVKIKIWKRQNKITRKKQLNKSKTRFIWFALICIFFFFFFWICCTNTTRWHHQRSIKNNIIW